MSRTSFDGRNSRLCLLKKPIFTKNGLQRDTVEGFSPTVLATSSIETALDPFSLEKA
jgi:hypothetical protein